ncbi:MULTISPECIES: hypothetical protein [Pseudomonas]|uniref:hypothetical protein n=1 Tax=Pseudomonas TaxID=286 RepID=UPI00040E09C1|nr:MULTISPECIES: hypothetical protein [Pseudomonas]
MRSTSIPLDFPDSDQVIYASENLVAIFCPASETRSRQLVVAFHALQLTQYLDLPRKGQSRETLRAAGLDSVQVIPRGNQWYQYGDIDEMILAIRTISDTYQEVVAYGQSMGAYAAIHTSAALQPSKVLAICPQFSVDPARISFDSGFKVLAADIDFVRDDISKNASSETEFVIAFDQLYQIDNNHYNEYEKNLKNLYRLRMPFCGHGVSESLKQAGMIPGHLLSLITDGKAHINIVRQEFRRNRHRVQTYLDAMKLRLAKWYSRNKNLAEASRHAFSLYESTRLFSSMQIFCEAAEKAGSPEQAASRWFFAISTLGSDAPSLAYVRAAKFSRLSGEMQIAKCTCLSGLKKFHKDLGVMRELLDIHIEQQNLEEARKLAKHIKDVHGSKATDILKNRRSVLFA